MIHLHVRDKDQRHSLSPKHYKPAVKAVKEAVADEMLVQVTSEAAGLYSADEQMQLMLQLMPDFMSLAIRELSPTGAPVQAFAEFIKRLSGEGCLLQYILYDAADYERYKVLVETGIIAEAGHSLLFVLGRYTENSPTVDIVAQYQDILSINAPWMVCTFGPNSHQILSKSVALGCQVRVGFENGFYLPDGTIAGSNAELVKKSWQSFSQSGRTLADIHQTRVLLGLST